MIGSKLFANSFDDAEEEAERRADQQRQRVALRHPHQRIPGEAQDALVQLAALLERREDVRLAHLPGLRRATAGSVDQRRADERPQPSSDDAAADKGSSNQLLERWSFAVIARPSSFMPSGC